MARSDMRENWSLETAHPATSLRTFFLIFSSFFKPSDLLDRRKDEFVFCGDSPNDEPLFQYFPISCGVANVKDFKSEMTHLPKYVSTSKGGKGFIEICKKIFRL